MPVSHRPHTQIRIFFFLSQRTNIPNLELFPNRIFNRTFSNCRSHNSPVKKTADSAQEEKLGLPHWTRILAICVPADVSKYLDTLTGIFDNVGASSILAWVLADTASSAWLAHRSTCEIVSMIFAAVICDADDPCSKKYCVWS